MRLYAVLPAVIALLQREGRVTYRALQRDFGFDAAFLDDLRYELLFKRMAIDEDGKGLVWTGGAHLFFQSAVPPTSAYATVDTPGRPASAPVALPPLDLAPSMPVAVPPSLPDDLPTSPPQSVPTTSPEARPPATVLAVPTATRRDGATASSHDTSPATQHDALQGLLAPLTTPPAALAAGPADDGQAYQPPEASVTAAALTWSAPEAERRHLTVMFCDLVGSTALSSHLDPEDLRDVVRAYQETAARVIQRFEGYIAQYLGDGLLVYFGYPLAYEDAVQRAVYTGLGIVEAVQALNMRLATDYGVQLAVRLGIHTGPVVVGAIGAGGRHEYLALGETPNIAARLEGLAAPNTVVLSAVTARLVRGVFALEAMGLQELKGVAEPLAVARVLGPLEAANGHEDAEANNAPLLMGRDEEIGLLWRRWEQSKEGLGQVVLLNGETGIGKSALVGVLRDRVNRQGLTRITMRCSAYHTAHALYPVIVHLQRLLGFQPDETPATKLDKLERVLQTYRFPLHDMVPLIAALLAIPLPEGRYAAQAMTPEQQRQWTLDALVAWLVQEAERQPTLVIWEDLHMADPSTLELLSLLVDQIPTVAMLSVLTFRPEFVPPWAARSHMTPITLNRLERPQVKAIITQLAGGKTLPVEVVELIVTKTDGVPLFVEELTKMLLESKLLYEEADRYVLSGTLGTVAIPDTLQDALMARLDQLNTAKEVVQFGAVLGREFSYEVLRALSGMDEAELQAGLTRLVKAELLYQRGRPPRATYVFKHALIQDVAYESLLRSTRQQYHVRTVQLLPAQFADVVETQPELLGHHALCGQLWEQAHAYFHQAGTRAMARSANQEAVTCFEQALVALHHLPEQRTVQAQEIDLHCDLRAALMPLGKFQQVLNTLRTAERLATTIDDAERLGRITSYLANLFWEMGEQQQAIASCHRALDLATTLTEGGLQDVAHRYLGRSYHAVGDYRQAIALLKQHVAPPDSERQGEAAGQVRSSSESSRVFLVLSLAEGGAFAEGIAYGEAGLRRAEAGNRLFDLATGCSALGRLYLSQGDLSQAIPLLERGLKICQSAHLPLVFPITAAPLGMAYALAGRMADALPLLEQAVERAAAMQRMVEYALWVAWLSEVSLLAGRLEAAHDLAQRALTSARTYQECGHEAWILRLLGTILAQGNEMDTAQAMPYFQQALRLAEAGEMRPLQAHCYLGLGRLYGRSEQAPEAAEALTHALALYRDLEMALWLPQADAALAQATKA
ncbi:MAG: adenylate/guanylate cyclase domain-containing protein [Candidatus Entotheonellia bacterium]